MKIKLGELAGISQSLNNLLSEKVPVKTAYKLGKLLKKVNKELGYYDENRMVLINQYAKKDKSGKLIVSNDVYDFEPEKRVLFDVGYAELCDIEADIEFEPIPLDSLGDISIRPVDMASLDIFLKE